MTCKVGARFWFEDFQNGTGLEDDLQRRQVSFLLNTCGDLIGLEDDWHRREKSSG